MTVYRNISNHVAVFNGVSFNPGESKDVDFFVMSPYMVESKTTETIESNEDKPKRRYRKRQKQYEMQLTCPVAVCDDVPEEPDRHDDESSDDSDAEEISKSEESEQETSNIE